MTRPYFTLIASLPALPPTFEVPRPPISRPRLERRLGMLEPQDRAVSDALEAHLRWDWQPRQRTAAEFRRSAADLLALSSSPALHEIVRQRQEIRTLVAALRSRRAGEPPPGPDWGSSELLWAVRARWSEPAFGLRGRHPWLPEVAERIGGGDPMELERRLLHVIWAHHHRLADQHPFGFDAVLVYLCRWDIVERWTHYDPVAGRARLDDLIQEALGDRLPRFA